MKTIDTSVLTNVTLKDVGETILQYCLEIPAWGINCEMKTTYGGTLPCPIKAIKPGDYGYAIKVYGEYEDNKYFNNDTSFIRFTTADGRNFLARGSWVVPYLQAAGYTSNPHLNPQFRADSSFIYPDARISALLNHLPNFDPIELLNKSKNDAGQLLSLKQE